MTLMQPDKSKVSRILKSYGECAAKFSATQQFTKGVLISGDDMLIVKYQADIPLELCDRLQEFAQEIQKHHGDGLLVVLLPEPFDITSMPRDEAVKWLKKMLAQLGKPAESEQPAEYVIPKLSDEKMEEFRQTVKNAPPGMMRPLEDDSLEQCVGILCRLEGSLVFRRQEGFTTLKVTARNFTSQRAFSDKQLDFSKDSVLARELKTACRQLDAKVGS